MLVITITQITIEQVFIVIKEQTINKKVQDNLNQALKFS
jgi:hypothetical protein